MMFSCVTWVLRRVMRTLSRSSSSVSRESSPAILSLSSLKCFKRPEEEVNTVE